VAFAPGQAILTPQATAYLQKVGEKLAQRPEVALKLLGLAAPEDWYAVTGSKSPTPAASVDLQKITPEAKDHLLAIAQKRADTLRSFFVDTFHIDPKRLFETAPQIDLQASSLPRAEISL
jgi:hypothetical protein